MSKLNNGHIAGAEQKALNQQENAVSRQIGRYGRQSAAETSKNHYQYA